jgi:peptide/nickel transport system substrate-binding protein
MIMKSLRFRRPLVATVAITVASVSLTACGGSDPDDTGSSGPTVIRALLAAQPATLDPIVGARSAQIVWATMLEPLIDTDDNLAPTDTGLITDWTRTDATTWTFTVRPDISFSNGEPADAAAVANTITLTRDTEGSPLKSYFGNVTSIEATDDATVVVTTGTPQYNIPDLLTTVYLVPPAYYQEQGSEGFAAAPIGTGPYVWAGANAGRDISVTKNPDYWGDEPTNDGITFTWANESAQRLALIQSRSVDISFDLPPAQASAAEAAGVEVVRTETAMKIIAFLDSTKEPFDDPSLREAAALAIDRDAIPPPPTPGCSTSDQVSSRNVVSPPTSTRRRNSSATRLRPCRSPTRRRSTPTSKRSPRPSAAASNRPASRSPTSRSTTAPWCNGSSVVRSPVSPSSPACRTSPCRTTSSAAS